MLKMVGVLYHKHYLTACEAAGELAQVLDLKLYSSRLLDAGGQSMASLDEDLSRADAAVLNMSSADGCRTGIEEKVEALDIPAMDIGGESVGRIRAEQELSAAAKCSLYASYGGRENYVNLFRYVAHTLTGADIGFEEPRFIPCEGLFHPDTGEVFRDIEEYFRFRPKSKKGTVGLIAARNNWVNGNLQPEIALIRSLEAKGFGVAPIFSDDCYPDICAGNLPCLYLYNSNNPSEGAMARRRGLSVLVDHMQAPMAPGGVYDRLEELDRMLSGYDKIRLTDKAQASLLEDRIREEIVKANLQAQVDLTDYHERFDRVAAQAHKVLTGIKTTQIQDGLHVFGRLPKDETAYITSIVRYEGSEVSFRSSVAALIGVELSELLAEPEGFCARYQKNNGGILFDLESLLKRIVGVFLKGSRISGDLDLMGYEMADPDRLEEINGHRERILDIRERFRQSGEMDSLLSGMDARFIPPGPAGVITRGRDDVLPTGRNFYTLDPDAIPTKAACEVGRQLGDRMLEKYRKEEGRYPENFSIHWMNNDIMWTDGEDMGQLLYLLGVQARWKPNGRVEGFTVIPAEELGRPRIDVTVRASGILRDNFSRCLEFLDEAIQAVSALDEPPEINYVRKHTLENMAEDPTLTFEEAGSRIFAPKPGSYGSGVNLAVYASAWKDRKDLAELFSYANGYSYGRAGYGRAAWGQLHNCLKTVDITYGKVASDENDLLSRGGFGAHGGLTAAAREISGHEVRTYYGDTREASHVEVRTLSEELNRVARGKLLNPRWIEGQKEHGYTGATNISRGVERLYGWEATTDEVDDGVFDDIVKTFIADEANRKFLIDNNPWAMEEMTRRLKEAYERKLWKPEDGLIEELTDGYLELEGFMEEDMGEAPGDFQGGAIDMVDLNELKSYRRNIEEMRKHSCGKVKKISEGAAHEGK